MIDISFVVDKPYQENEIFKMNSPAAIKYHRLKEEFGKQGFSLNTHDLCLDKHISIAIYFDIPDDFLEIFNPNIKNYALLIESPLIKPNNFNLALYKHFDKIFTWSNDLIAQNNHTNKFIKINYAFDFKKNIISEPQQKEKLCSLIVSNKSSNFKDELYSKRKDIVRWFEKNHPNDFDLYGKGWNECRTSNPLIKRLVKSTLVKDFCLRIRGKFFPSYSGEVDDKIYTLSKYKFTIAFENIQNVSGYITEKIFDAFFANCVPIYLGANDILDVIPKNCFIDIRDFTTYNELYLFLTHMTDDDYLQYLDNINNFLSNRKSDDFKVESFVKKIVNGILNDTTKK
ncbi:glycosyltransferase family 10 domain-containing protein [Sulfurovum sp.]|uniref:glycosyltransferase family 10 domain-containing protein n=1 Tax=Sulfurovum sp. TaxID=1969726 RepID=UPI0035644B95